MRSNKTDSASWRREAGGVRLLTRNGYDFTDRYPLIVDAIRSIPAKSCIVDGEAIVVDKASLSVFDLISYRRHDHAATICAFDLIEVDMHAPTTPLTSKRNGVF
jgi:ATP-dependent DNA ligase